MDPIVIDPPNFDQKAAWAECAGYVEKCGGLSHEDGTLNMRAVSGADPGVCSCPACGTSYWCWGNVQRCRVCEFEYPTDWWPMYSWGAQANAGRKHRGSWPYKHDEHMKHPYYRYGFEHPSDDPWEECHTDAWRTAITKAMAKGGGA